MPRLLLTDLSGVTREIRLVPGINRLGRSAENDHPLDDPSISRFHCEIHVQPDRVLVKDLNSANGTSLDGQPLAEGVLSNGGRLRLGAVETMFVEDDSAPASEAAAVPPVVPATLARVRVVAVRPILPGEVVASTGDACVRHPGVAPTFVCQRCGHQFCPSCVQTRFLSGRTFHSCPDCEGSCVSLDAIQQERTKEEAGFLRLALGAFGYPVRGGGLALLICGAVFFSLLDGAMYLAKFAPLYGLIVALMLLVFSVGYLFTFMRGIVLETSNGSDRPPRWPGYSGFWDDAVVPFFQVLAIWLVCLGPGTAVMIWVSPLAGAAVMLLGVFCVPMCLLTVSLADSVMGLNPVIVFSSIGKAPGAYLVACIVFLVVLAVRVGLEALARQFGIPVLPSLLGNFLAIYGLVVEMRILGLFYYRHRDRLAWFSAGS